MTVLLILALVLLSNFGQQEDKVITKLSLDTFKDKILEENGFYYIGSDVCGDCQVFYPYLLHLVRKYQIHIYYLNIDAYKETQRESYEDLIDFLQIKQIPSIVVVKDKEISCILSHPDLTRKFTEYLSNDVR